MYLSGSWQLLSFQVLPAWQPESPQNNTEVSLANPGTVVSAMERLKWAQIDVNNPKNSLCIVAAKTEIRHKLKQFCLLKLCSMTPLAVWWCFGVFRSPWGYIIELLCLCEHYVSVHVGLQVSLHAPVIHHTAGRAILDRHSSAGILCLEDWI